MTRFYGQRVTIKYHENSSDPASCQWEKKLPYEFNTVVCNNGDTYISKRDVPPNIDITNSIYWLKWKEFNSQVEAYKNSVLQYARDVEKYKEKVDENSEDITQCVKKVTGKNLSTNDYTDNDKKLVGTINQKASYNDLNLLKETVKNMGSLTPKGVYNTLDELKLALPSGDNNIFVISGTNKWAYWDGSTWIEGGDFVNGSLGDSSVTLNNLETKLKNDITNYIQVTPIYTSHKAWILSEGKAELGDYLQADASNPISVNEGDVLTLSVEGANAALYVIVLVDDDFNVIEKYYQDAMKHNITLNIGSGVTKLLLTIENGSTSTILKQRYLGIASQKYVDDKVDNKDSLSDLKYVVCGDSIMSDEVSGIGTIINQFLGTNMIGNFAHGNAKLSDWHSGDTNTTVITPNTVTNANDNTNVLSNQIRRIIKNCTPTTEQTSWKERLTMNGDVEGTNVNTYTLNGDEWKGDGNTSQVPDIAFIQIGINDGTLDTPIVDDTDSVFNQEYSRLNRCSFASSLRWAIETLQFRFPGINIFVGSPLQVWNKGGIDRLTYNNIKLRRDIIEKVCKFDSVNFIDSFGESGYNINIAKGYGSYDGVHPWQPWRNYIAEFIANQIRKRYVKRIEEQ